MTTFCENAYTFKESPTNDTDDTHLMTLIKWWYWHNDHTDIMIWWSAQVLRQWVVPGLEVQHVAVLPLAPGGAVLLLQVPQCGVRGEGPPQQHPLHRLCSQVNRGIYDVYFSHFWNLKMVWQFNSTLQLTQSFSINCRCLQLHRESPTALSDHSE